MAGIIVASLVCRPLIGKVGRVLVIIGLGVTLAGAVGLWAMSPSVLVLGAGMGACLRTQHGAGTP